MTQAFNLSQFANKVDSTGKADLTTAVTGTLPVANGGTGVTSPGTSGNLLTSNGTSWVSSAPPSTGVTSFNTRTGSVTLSSSDVTTALTFTPVSTDLGYNAVGSLCFCRGPTSVSSGSTYAGSSLYPASGAEDTISGVLTYSYSSTSLSGTWRALGYGSSYFGIVANKYTIFQRIA